MPALTVPRAGATDMTYQRVPVYSLRLIKEKSIKYLPTMGNESAAATAIRSFLHDKDCEHLVVLLLDSQNHFIGIHDVATGGIAGLRAGVRDIFKAAIVGNAAGLVLGHCHPSGNTDPSEEDVLFTRAVMAASVVMGIPVLDHVIVSSGVGDGHFSFLSHGIQIGRAHV